MSEYQRYEFMTIDRPLTKAELDKVRNLSSHIEATSTQAVIEYHWGDFKHDPIKVLHNYFDAFLYYANWGSRTLAFRFPHGILPDNLFAGYNFDEDFVSFEQHSKFDILTFEFNPEDYEGDWVEYNLNSLVDIREELMTGDLRSFYIVWLGISNYLFGWEDKPTENSIPAVPPNFAHLTKAQQELAILFEVPTELLSAASAYSKPTSAAPKDDFALWVTLLPEEKRTNYLLRLAQNEPGLSHQLARELRQQHQEKLPTGTVGERIPFDQLLTESKAIKIKREQKKREREERKRLEHLTYVQQHADVFWGKAEQSAQRKTSTGYDEAHDHLKELHEAAKHFNTTQQFEERLNRWIESNIRRPALIKRLQASGILP